MEWFFLLTAIVIFLLGAGAQVLVIFGLPGTWVLLFIALLIELVVDSFYLPDEDPQTFSWWVLGVCVGIALIGEIIEFATGVLGAKYGGATRRGMWGALIGGLLGAIVLTPIFFFVPVVGTLCGALAGTFLGAMVGEMSAANAPGMRETIKPASGAMFGRVLGTMGKLGVSLTVWLVLTVSAFVR